MSVENSYIEVDIDEWDKTMAEESEAISSPEDSYESFNTATETILTTTNGLNQSLESIDKSGTDIEKANAVVSAVMTAFGGSNPGENSQNYKQSAEAIAEQLTGGIPSLDCKGLSLIIFASLIKIGYGPEQIQVAQISPRAGVIGDISLILTSRNGQTIGISTMSQQRVDGSTKAGWAEEIGYEKVGQMYESEAFVFDGNSGSFTLSEGNNAFLSLDLAYKGQNEITFGNDETLSLEQAGVHFIRAIGYFNEALSLDPNNLMALEGLGKSQMSMGNLQEGKRILSEIQRIDPGYPVYPWMNDAQSGATISVEASQSRQALSQEISGTGIELGALSDSLDYQTDTGTASSIITTSGDVVIIGNSFPTGVKESDIYTMDQTEQELDGALLSPEQNDFYRLLVHGNPLGNTVESLSQYYLNGMNIFHDQPETQKWCRVMAEILSMPNNSSQNIQYKYYNGVTDGSLNSFVVDENQMISAKSTPQEIYKQIQQEINYGIQPDTVAPVGIKTFSGQMSDALYEYGNNLIANNEIADRGINGTGYANADIHHALELMILDKPNQLNEIFMRNASPESSAIYSNAMLKSQKRAEDDIFFNMPSS